MVLNLNRLENVRRCGSNTIARCPACAEVGGDCTGDHLFITPKDQFGCVLYPGPEGQSHRKRIFELVGIKKIPSRDFEIKKPFSATLGHTVIQKDILGHLGHFNSTHARNGLNPPKEEVTKNLKNLQGSVPSVPNLTACMVDRVSCEREIAKDEQERRDIKRYRFRTVSEQSALESSSEELSCSYSAPIAAPMETPGAPDETEHFIKTVCSEEDVLKGSEPSGAIGADMSNKSLPSVDIKGCHGCNFFKAGYCSRYEKQCCEIAECQKRIHY